MMSKKKLDYTIEKYQDRLDFLIENGFIERLQQADNKMSEKGDLEYFKNSGYEQIATYLFRSKDLDSYYDIEYSHYRDLYQFLKSMSSKKLKEKNDKINDREFVGKKNVDLYIHKDGFDEQLDSAEIEQSYEKMNSVDDDYVNKLFKYDNLTIKEIKSILKNYLYFIDDIENESLINNLTFVVSEVEKACSNSEDKKVFLLFLKGKSEAEIADEIGKSRQSVHKRINKIIRKSKLIYEK